MLWAVSVMTIASSFTAAADEPKQSAELKVLDGMIGTWDEVVTHKPSVWVPKEVKMTSLTKKSWSLGNKYVRMEGSFQPEKVDFLALMTFDANVKAYRAWYFDGHGTTPSPVPGVWDDKTQALTMSGKDEFGYKVVSVHRFINKDRHEWTYVITSPEGKLMLDMEGNCTRHKE